MKYLVLFFLTLLLVAALALHRLQDGQHWLWAGMTRYGKSEAVLSRVLIPAMRAKNTSIVLIDPTRRGTLARKFLLHAAYRGQTYRVLLDMLAATKRTLGYAFAQGSRHSDSVEQRKENEAIRETNLRSLLQRREMQAASKTPVIEEGMQLLLDLALYQDAPFQFRWLEQAFDPESSAHLHLVSHCTRKVVAEKVLRWARKKGQDWLFHCGPALRIIRQFTDKILVTLRDGASFDFHRFLNGELTQGKPGIFIVSGESEGDLTDDAVQIIGGTIVQNVLHHTNSNPTWNTLLVLDEGQGAGLVDANIARAAREQAKNGLSMHLIVHNIVNFSTPEVVEDIFDNTFHAYFRMSGESVRKAADDIGVPLLNPDKIKHEEERFQQFWDGHEFRKTASTNVSKDEQGHKREGHTSGEQALSKYRVERYTIKHYTTYDEQIREVQQALMGMDPGWMLYRDKKVSPQPVYVPMARDPFASSLTMQQHLYDTALAQILANPAYRVPVLSEAPCKPPMANNPAKGSAKNSSPQKTGKRGKRTS